MSGNPAVAKKTVTICPHYNENIIKWPFLLNFFDLIVVPVLLICIDLLCDISRCPN